MGSEVKWRPGTALQGRETEPPAIKIFATDFGFDPPWAPRPLTGHQGPIQGYNVASFYNALTTGAPPQSSLRCVTVREEVESRRSRRRHSSHWRGQAQSRSFFG